MCMHVDGARAVQRRPRFARARRPARRADWPITGGRGRPTRPPPALPVQSRTRLICRRDAGVRMQRGSVGLSLSLSLSLSVSLARARSGGSRLARRDSPSRFPIDFFRHAAHKVIFVTIIVERLRHQGQRLIILQLTNVSLTYDTASVERDFSRFFVLPTTVRHRKSCVACGYRFESPRLLIKIPLETRELVQRSLVRRPVSKRVRNAVRLGHKFNDRDKFAIGVT
jgi:hypothetical protein